MRVISLVSSRGAIALVLLAMMLTGCQFNQSSEPPRTVQLQQSWELQPGDTLSGRRVGGSLGDISIELDGNRIFAPFDGRVQPDANIEGCVIFSSADVPAYLFRLCGLRNPQLGAIRRGNTIGTGDYLHFATLRRQPDGTWAMVEPSRDILERMLTAPP
jgi:hypothetical protein